VSEDQYAAPAQVATTAVPAAGRVGYVPARANRVRDGLAVGLLIAALLLPWSIDFGVGVPGSSAILFVVVVVVTLLAIAAALAPHVGPWRLTAPQPDLGRTIRIRFWLTAAYLLCVLGFIGFHIVATIRYGGTGAVPPGAGPGIWLGAAGAVLAAQPPITSITIEDNGFGRWYGSVRIIGMASIVLAAWAVLFNLFWRLRYLFVTTGTVGGHDVAVVITTLLYGGVAMVALVIGSAWLLQKTAAARLATTALGVSACVAGVLVWVANIGRDVDAFHGIAENTSTAAVGYEGYLAWAATAAIVAPTTLYAVFLVKPPTMAVYRGAALKCLTLIAFWTFAAAGLRVTDFLIALSLDLPRSLYDSFALMAFNVVTGCIAVWLQRQLAKGGLSSVVIAAFSGSLFVFTAAQLVIGVALAPRYADPTPRSPDAIYGNDLAQQITSMFDVVICVLSLAILVAVVVTGPLAGYLVRRRGPRDVTPAPAVLQRPQQTTVPKIVRLKQDSAALLATAEVPVATTALRIQRRPEPPSPPAATDATQHIPTSSESPSSKANAERSTVPAKRPSAAGTPAEGPASEPIPEAGHPDEGRS
jgi:hypothetical protein